MNCPSCQREFDRSTSILARLGAVLLRCRSCQVYQIEGDDYIFRGRDSAKDVVKRAELIREWQNEVARRHQEMIETDITDPRWVQ